MRHAGWLVALVACGTPDEGPGVPIGGPAPAPEALPAAVEVTSVEVLAEASGVRLERVAFRYDGEAGLAWRARFPRDARLQVVGSDAVVPLGKLAPTGDGPWVAINGGFYDAQGPMGLVIADGVTRHPLARRGGSGIVVADPGPIRILHRDVPLPDVRQARQSIDRLVADGKVLVGPGASGHLDARSALALTPDAVWLVIAADADGVVGTGDTVQLVNTTIAGLPLHAFARWLADDLHATDALNLDGAVSTQLIAQIGERRIEVLGEKGTIDALVVRPP